MKKLKNLLVLVLPDENPEKKTNGGIIIPATVRDKAEDAYGTVLLTGGSTKEFSVDVKVGDRIIFNKKPGNIQVEKGEIIHMDDVIGVL